MGVLRQPRCLPDLGVVTGFLLVSALCAGGDAAEIIDLRDGAPATFYGGFFPGPPAAGDFYGWAIAFGDIDGDGLTDFISSSTNSEGPNDELNGHYVYVYFGRPRAEIQPTYAIDDPGIADIVIYRGGFAIACADLDRDGYDDLILAEQAGYVIFGAPRNELHRVYQFDSTSVGYTPPDISILGTFRIGGTTSPFGGASDEVILALVAGDLNDDGYGDIVIGDFRANTGRQSGGAAFIIFGRPREAFPAVIDTDPSTALPHPDVMIIGNTTDWYPFHMAIGDFDGDQVDDLVALTIRGRGEETVRSGSGEIHGFFGKKQWQPLYDMQLEEFDFAIYGSEPMHRIGYRLASGDLDGDGRDELIAGEIDTEADQTRDFGGEYRIYFGRPRNMWPRWGRVNEMTDVFILGGDVHDVNNNAANWTYPLSIATGNHDEDRYEDLLIGAGHAAGPNESRRGAGEVYLFQGRPRGLWQPFLDLRDDYDLIVYGADAVPSPGHQYDLLGFATGFGDIDGNGVDELFMSALNGDGPNNFSADVGEIYIFFADDSVTVGVDPSRPPIAHSKLFPSAPNPFRTTTTLQFSAPRDESVSLTIYDARGRLVAHPLLPEENALEQRTVQWSATADDGTTLPSGVYFVKLRAGRETHTQKVVLVR